MANQLPIAIWFSSSSRPVRVHPLLLNITISQLHEKATYVLGHDCVVGHASV
jgi:hypothetical protein